MRSYRELPLRLAEFGTVYRYEQSGELGGLTRVRGFTVDDSHLFVTPQQLETEFLKVVDLILSVFESLRLKNFKARLSFREPGTDKYIGTNEVWDKAENAIRNAVITLGMDYFEAPEKPHFMVRSWILFFRMLWSANGNWERCKSITTYLNALN